LSSANYEDFPAAFARTLASHLQENGFNYLAFERDVADALENWNSKSRQEMLTGDYK